MACAMSSLPEPVSPEIRTVESVGATTATCFSRARKAGLRPIMPLNAGSASSSGVSDSSLETSSSVELPLSRSIPARLAVSPGPRCTNSQLKSRKASGLVLARPRTPMGRSAIVRGTPQKDFIPLSSKTEAKSGKRHSFSVLIVRGS